MRKIIVIGQNNSEDDTALYKAGEWLAQERQRPDLQVQLDMHDYDAYDMLSRPEKGDALDAIDGTVELVVALHLYGIDQLHGSEHESPIMYNRANGSLLRKCMGLGIRLIVWGDQPWLGVEQKTQIHENQLWAYEPTV